MRMHVRVKGIKEAKETLRSIRTALKHEDDRILWGYIFNVMGLIYRRRFRDAQAYPKKKRPNVYGNRNLIRTGKMFRALTETRDMHSYRKKFRGHAMIGYRGLPYIDWVSGGVPTIPIRTRRARSIDRKLTWIDEHGFRHAAQFTQDKRPSSIPARPILISHKKFQPHELRLLDTAIKKYFHRKFGNIR